MKDAQFWDRIAEKYAKSPVRDEAAYARTLERTRAHLGTSDRVLELGCGTGTTALKLADAVGQMTGTDLAPGMIEIARRRAAEAEAQNVTFDVAPVETLPEGPFDVAMAFNLLHLVRDLDGALAQVHDRLRPGGLFISKTVCLKGAGMPLWMSALLCALPVMKLVGKAPSVVHRFSVTALEDAVTRAGFEIIETGNYPAKPISRFIVARKVG